MTNPSPSLDLSFRTVGARTVFFRKRVRWPQYVGRLFPGSLDGSGTVIVQNTGAAIHPGDVIDQQIEVGPGCVVELRGQGAIQVTGTSNGSAARETTRLRIIGDGQLIYRPVPKILTPQGRLVQATEVLMGHGSAVMVDAFVLHPEVTSAEFGSYRSVVRVVSADSEPLMVDAQHIDSRTFPKELRAFGTVYVFGGTRRRVETWLLTPAATGIHAAVTVLPNGVGSAVRIAAVEGGALCRALNDVVDFVR